MNTIPENRRETRVRKIKPGKGPRQGERQATPSPDTGKFAGAGPAVAERSKDAKAPKGGRQPGAYVKD